MQGNKLGIIIGVVLLLLVVAGGAYYLTRNKTEEPIVQEIVEEEVVEELKPEEIGLTSEVRADKKAVKFTITKASDIDHVEYQLAYTKEVNNEQIPEGLIGEILNSDKESSLSIDFRELGTCSSGKCRYDTVVSDVRVILKVTKSGGKVYQVEDVITL